MFLNNVVFDNSKCNEPLKFECRLPGSHPSLMDRASEGPFKSVEEERRLHHV